MPRDSRIYWSGIAAALLLLAAFFLFDAGDSTLPSSGVTLRMGSAPLAPPREDAAAPNSGRAEVQQMINSGQFAPPPGNPDKMYSIASPFAAAAPAVTSGSSAGNAGTSQSPAGVQPGIAMLGANPGGSAPAQLVKRNAPPATSPAQLQAPGQPVEFETPPGIGSAKGSQ
ncbi:MAG: hypothetical protein NTY41_02740 [Proteobacteria bacterium]|nr:hypothetical protein [Pseudomonadota bacterium]